MPIYSKLSRFRPCFQNIVSIHFWSHKIPYMFQSLGKFSSTAQVLNNVLHKMCLLLARKFISISGYFSSVNL